MVSEYLESVKEKATHACVINGVGIVCWNLQPFRLFEIFEYILQGKVRIDTVIHIYEPLRDVEGSFYETFFTDANLNNIFVVFSGEGHSEKEYDKLVERLIYSDPKTIKPENLVFYTAASELSTHEFKHVQNISGILNTTLDLSGDSLRALEIKNVYSFLNREHRWQRQRLYEELCNRGLLEFGVVTYLTVPYDRIGDSRYPRIYDKSSITVEEGYDLGPMQNSFFNIVSESSYENLNDLLFIDVPGFSEKTFKTILLSQIPIFLSTYKTVYHYRLLGFDAFDDIVDHSYDLIENAEERINAIASEFDTIVRRYSHIEDCKKLRKKLKRRMEKNYQHMLSLLDINKERENWWKIFRSLGII